MNNVVTLRFEARVSWIRFKDYRSWCDNYLYGFEFASCVSGNTLNFLPCPNFNGNCVPCVGMHDAILFIPGNPLQWTEHGLRHSLMGGYWMQGSQLVEGNDNSKERKRKQWSTQKIANGEIKCTEKRRRDGNREYVTSWLYVQEIYFDKCEIALHDEFNLHFIRSDSTCIFMSWNNITV